jgi:hypothetical protein
MAARLFLSPDYANVDFIISLISAIAFIDAISFAIFADSHFCFHFMPIRRLFRHFHSLSPFHTAFRYFHCIIIAITTCFHAISFSLIIDIGRLRHATLLTLSLMPFSPPLRLSFRHYAAFDIFDAADIFIDY